MESSEVKYWIGFNLIQGIGPAKFSLLLDHFSELKRAWEASASELGTAGLDRRSVNAITARRSQISLEAELNRLEQYNIKVITWKDPEYPRRLREIDGSPPVLYVRGSLLSDDECCVAVVGTRRASAYGRQSAEELASELARNGVTIVSGLARGIDTVAHEAALQAGGRIIAVSACGLDMVYPSSNSALARHIMEQGALISEFPLGATPRAEHFPLRNRIISGMSIGVLVVEAGERSGALITAHQAAEQNREVFAVPGNIFSPASKGTNTLIQEGAKLVRNCSDILEELNLSVVAEQLEMKEIVPASDVESQLLSYLSSEGTYIDEICHRSGLPVSAVSGIITMLELKGLAKQVGNATYALA